MGIDESRVGGAIRFVGINESRVGGACGPPPPFVAPLVPRCALTSGATPRDVLSRRLRPGRPKIRQARNARWPPRDFATTRVVGGPLSGIAGRRKRNHPPPKTESPTAENGITTVEERNQRPSKTVRPESDGRSHVSGAAKHVAGGRPGSECAARHERSNERGRGAAGSPDPALVYTNVPYGSPDPDLVMTPITLKADRHSLNPIDKVAAQAFGLTCQLDVGEPTK
jgi:hypothetical protein